MQSDWYKMHDWNRKQILTVSKQGRREGECSLVPVLWPILGSPDNTHARKATTQCLPSRSRLGLGTDLIARTGAKDLYFDFDFDFDI